MPRDVTLRRRISPGRLVFVPLVVSCSYSLFYRTHVRTLFQNKRYNGRLLVNGYHLGVVFGDYLQAVVDVVIFQLQVDHTYTDDW